ncbi:MAG: DUF1573 domain-containing protein [Chitinivibrionales bacterium]|nr:DUF1573 domain-containing protein [Chitinivibrionales bacterium]
MKMMYSKIFKAFVLVVGLIFAATATPMISVDSADFDVGEIREGSVDKIKHEFTIKNTGDEVLKIEKVKPG